MSRVLRSAVFVGMTLASAHGICERLEFDAGEHASTPSLAVDPARGLVLTWQTRSEDVATLHYALLDAAGHEQRRGEIASGKNWFVNWADFPSLAVLDNSDWVTFWLQKSDSGAYAYDIHVLRSANGGGRWGKALLPHDDATATEHGFVALLPIAGDRVQIAWLDGRNGTTTAADHAASHSEEGAMSLRGAVLEGSGRYREGQELDARTCSCCQTDAARVGDRQLLVYRDRSANEVRDISLVERVGAGAWSAPQTVHADQWQTAACPVNGPSIAANGGRAIIAWPTLAGGTPSVRYLLRQGDANGPMQTLELAAAVLGRVDSSAAEGEGFAISWIGAGGDGPALKLAEIGGDGKLRRVRVVATVDGGRDIGFPRLVWYRGAHYLTWTESAGAGNSRVILERW